MKYITSYILLPISSPICILSHAVFLFISSSTSYFCYLSTKSSIIFNHSSVMRWTLSSSLMLLTLESSTVFQIISSILCPCLRFTANRWVHLRLQHLWCLSHSLVWFAYSPASHLYYSCCFSLSQIWCSYISMGLPHLLFFFFLKWNYYATLFLSFSPKCLHLFLYQINY